MARGLTFNQPVEIWVEHKWTGIWSTCGDLGYTLVSWHTIQILQFVI